MHDDGFHHAEGRHAQAVGEVEVALPRATAPAGVGAGDAHRVDIEAVAIHVGCDQIVGDLSGFLAIPGDEDVPSPVTHVAGEVE